MTSTPPDIGQPTREARTGREDRGQRGNKWWTLVAVCLGTFMLLLDSTTTGLPATQPRTPKRPPSSDDLGASVVEGAWASWAGSGLHQSR
jgi:hypothetical protein